MLVVFEGPDGAGKTTLLHCVHEKLREARPAERRVAVYRNLPRPDCVIGWPDAHVVHAEYNALAHVELSSMDLLKDRFWVTDQVYGRVFLRDPYDRSYVNPWGDFKQQVLVVHVNVRDWKVLAQRRNVTWDDDMYEFLPKLRDGMDEYFKALNAEPKSRSWCPSLTLYTDGGITLDAEAAEVVGSVLALESWSKGGVR